ncbi:RcnB family protein, partial [Escherichia coli]|nr:RcnB family protein [Escherichia coli]
MTIKNKMLLGALLLVTSAAWAAPATAGSTNTSGISKYELSSFIADFKHFKPGDTVPEMYRTDEYNIKQWQLRNLPAPDAGTHWTGNDSNLLIVFYVQIMPDDFVMQLHR